MPHVPTKPEHEVVYQDLVKLLRRHAHKVTSAELLAIGANMLGKIIALQDQRVMTREQALRIVADNIEFGNSQVLDALRQGKPEGTA